MESVTMWKCEGCGQIFQPEQLTQERQIGRHVWKPGRINTWSYDTVANESEMDCVQNMAEWNRKQEEYEQRREEEIRQAQIDERRIIDACGQDALLRGLLLAPNVGLARVRVKQIADEIGVDWETLTYGSSQWSEELRGRCFEAARGE